MLEDVVKYLSQKQHSADLISREYLEDLIGLEAETKSKMDVRESYEEFLPLIQNAEVNDLLFIPHIYRGGFSPKRGRGRDHPHQSQILIGK